MKILEISASFASIISLIISILFWQGDTQTQKILAITVFIVFIIATTFAVLLHKKQKNQKQNNLLKIKLTIIYLN